MKTHRNSLSGFFHPRILLVFALCCAGALLATFSFTGVPKFSAGCPGGANCTDGQTAAGPKLERDMPVPGGDPDNLIGLETDWNNRLTYPTGRFDPAWIRRAAAQDFRIARRIPAGTRAKMTKKKISGLSFDTSGFTALGPQPEHMTGCSGCYDYGTTEGRVNSVAIDPTTTTNGSIVAYIGSVGGGVWKTTNCCNSSTSWMITTDDPAISTTSIDTVTIDPNNHNTVYAGTGDLNYGSFSMGSQGILKSTDGGATWADLGQSVFGAALPEPAGQYPQYQSVGKVRVDPNNSSNVVAGTKTGLYFSYDGGNNWTGPCTTNSFNTQRQDITGLELVNVGGTTRIIAAVGVRGFATPVQYNLDQNGANGLYAGTMPIGGCPTDFASIASNANGFVFGTAVSGSPYTTGANMNAASGTPYVSATSGNQLGRIDIAVSPSNPNYIYAQVQSIAANNNSGCGNTNGCELGVWASIDGGTTWSFMSGSAGGSLLNCSSPTAGPGDYPQNWYDQGIAIDPNNPDRIFVDTFETWLATRTGSSFYDLTCGYNGNQLANHVVHVDHHAIGFVPGSSSILLEGSDGGIFSSPNADTAVAGTTRNTWVNMDNGLNAIEFYSGDISGSFATASAPLAVAGAQDNGPSSVTFTSGPAASQWQMGLGGDGFSGQIDPLGTGSTQAQGTITVATGAATAGQTFVVGPQTFTWVTTRAGTGQVTISATSTTAATNIVTAITADIPTTATASRSGSTVIVSATNGGSAGNSIPFYNNNSSDLTFNGSGTLGGTTPGDDVGSLRVWEGNNSGGLDRCVRNCTAPGATWTSNRGAWTSDTQSFVLPINLFHGGIPGGDDCPAAGIPGGCGHLIAGTTRVWETTTGNISGTGTWYVTNNPSSQNMTKQSLGNRSYINQVKYSPKFQSVAIVGTNDGNVQIGFNLGTGTASQATWVDVTGGNTVLPNRPIQGIALDPSVSAANLPVGYAAVGGFNANTPSTPGHVFQVSCAATCGSFTWLDKTGNLPDISVDSIIVNPNYPQQVFAGTDFGLYYTDDITQSSPVWYRFNNGLPNVMIWDMQVDRGATTLALFTRSRGAYAWPLPTGPLAVPTPTSVVSRKTHGGAGTFDINLLGSGVECRSGGATHDYTVVVTFANNVTVNGNGSIKAEVTAGSGQVGSAGTANGNSVSVAGSVVTVSTTNVANAQRLSVTIYGVNDGTNTGNVVVPMAVLLGDTTGNGTVDGSDVSQTKAQSGAATDSSNFREDVTVDGNIDASDVSVVKASSGTALP